MEMSDRLRNAYVRTLAKEAPAELGGKTGALMAESVNQQARSYLDYSIAATERQGDRSTYLAFPAVPNQQSGPFPDNRKS